MRKFFLIALTVLLAALLLVGCGGSQPKKIVVGLDDNFPPMGFRDEKNNIIGFDVDMAKEATKRLGMAVEFKPIDWSSKEAELSSKRVDVLWNGLTITEKRKENILFTKPYMENKQVIIVTANSKVKGKADLAGKAVGVQDGSSSVDAITKEAAILKSFKELKKYPDNVAALLDLKAGRIEALVVDEIVGRYYIAKKPGDYAVLSDHFGAEEYGVGLRKDDKELLTKLQKALDEMKQDGTSAKISKQWFGENIVK
ncbi:amino acid ABC transporter substrate-binding protein [Anaerosporomusa subterranea]|uniref:Amino acid ABC transporter substrate-binding protein n=1 Tax=Anaerosporomusa subterranea TaxID=1794912 RepID=A0A154BVR0_ANASB|nr:amino acid ABC transporter substrate-binding protein [Anaerosporomusa subterranea]KYZ78114.1 amino acid ABC transporter substrate-binding protein [Anaerosporomusa subterranea]